MRQPNIQTVIRYKGNVIKIPYPPSSYSFCCVIYFLVVDVSGTWKNELQSTMVVKQIGRTLFGNYCTAVSGYHLQRPKFGLVGNIGTGVPTSIGWVVTFNVSQTGTKGQ